MDAASTESASLKGDGRRGNASNVGFPRLEGWQS
jgi:hypothetical protein